MTYTAENERRALQGATLAGLFGDNGDDRDDVIDAITNLLHYAASQQWEDEAGDLSGILDMALQHVEIELAEAASEDETPD